MEVEVEGEAVGEREKLAEPVPPHPELAVKVLDTVGEVEGHPLPLPLEESEGEGVKEGEGVEEGVSTPLPLPLPLPHLDTVEVGDTVEQREGEAVRVPPPPPS